MEAAGAIRADVVVLTSSESADQLLTLIDRQREPALLRAPVAAMSQRIAAHAREIGFSGPMAVAPETSDDGLIAAIRQLASG
jgi:uroporphyrinogen-III synthase